MKIKVDAIEKLFLCSENLNESLNDINMVDGEFLISNNENFCLENKNSTLKHNFICKTNKCQSNIYFDHGGSLCN